MNLMSNFFKFLYVCSFDECLLLFPLFFFLQISKVKVCC